MKTDWYWVRQGTRPQDQGRYVGQLDLPVLPADARVARSLRAKLPIGGPWLVSPQMRARQSAQQLDAGVAPVEVADFADQSLGVWEGQRQNDVHKAHAQLDWSDPASIRPPEGESFTDLIDRVAAGIERLSGHYPDQPLVAVTHISVIRAAITLALNLTAQQGMAFDISPFSLTHLSWRGPDDLGNGEDRVGDWSVHCINLTVG